MPPRYKQPKRYYRRLATFPDGIDRLEAEVRLPVDEEQLERWVEEYFRAGGMNAIVGYIILRYGAWEEAMNLGRDGDPRIAFRAVWALEWAYEQCAPACPGEQHGLPEWFFDRMADDFAVSPNGSLHRIYAKMLCDRMRFGGVRPTRGQAEKLAERCFDLAADPGTKTAVKFWCLEILAELSSRTELEWVSDALESLMGRLSATTDISPGMKTALREISARLKIVRK